MAQPVLPVSAQSEINGLYVTLYDVDATQAGYNYWLGVLEAYDHSITSSGSSISTADAQYLGVQMTANSPVVNGTTYFATLYPAADTDVQYVEALYQNSANFQGTAGGIQYWTSLLTGLEASNGDNVIAAREAIAGEFVQAFLENNLSLGAAFWGLSATDYSLLVAGQQTLLNKITVSEFWAVNSTADSGLLNYTTTSSAAFAAAMYLNGQVNSSSSSVAAAEAAITAAIAADSLTPITSLVIPSNTLTLTTGIDSPTTGFSTGNGATATTAGAIFVSPGEGTIGGLGIPDNDLNTGDNLQDTVGDGTLELTIPAEGAILTNPIFATGVTMNGIKTLEVTNLSGGVGGFAGNITGMTTVDNNNSNSFVVVGLPGNGVNTELTQYNSNDATAGFGGIVAAAAFTGTANTINLDLTGNLGTAGLNKSGTGALNAVKLYFSPDSGASGYETWSITSNNSEFLVLGQSTGGTPGTNSFSTGTGAATSIVLLGKGNVELNAITAGDWAGLTAINASAATGNVTLTGKAANTAGGYYTSVSNTVGGTEAGLVTGAIALTSAEGGTGTNFFDLSAMTVAAIDAMTAINVAAGNTSTTNTLILPNGVVEQSAALANESGFQIIGDPGITGGTVTMSNFAGANELQLFGTETAGAVTIKAGPNPFTLDLNGDSNAGGSAWTINGPTSGTTNAFTLDMGNNAHVNAGAAPTAVGDVMTTLTLKGYDVATIDATGGPTPVTGAVDAILGGITMTPNIGGGESLTITGNTELAVLGTGINATFGSLIITDNDTGLFLIDGGTTNAGQINGSATSGGIWMFCVDTSSTGVEITGSAAAGNFLVGSNQADVINGGAGTIAGTTMGDVIDPNGGSNASLTAMVGDTINLAVGHSQPNSIDIYPTAGGIGLADEYVSIAASIVNASDEAQLGWFGVRTGDSTTSVFGEIGGVSGGISSSQVLVSNTIGTFIAGSGGDTIDFSVKAWGSGGLVGGTGVATHGLVEGDTATAVVGSDLAPVAAVFNAGGVSGGGTIAGGTTVVELAVVEPNATALEGYLANNAITFAGTGLAAAGEEVHMLWAYSDGTNVHIADVDFINNLGAAELTTKAASFIAVSDLVELQGVSLSSLVGANIHFVA